MTRSITSRKSVVLIGAGSAVFTRGLLADLISAPDLGPWQIRLVDINEEALDVAVRLARRMVAERRRDGDITVDGWSDRTEALPGADFVVTTVGVGGRVGWERDWEVARRHGIFQPVGDSVMPGGISRAMQTVPVLVEIASDVKRLAPGAMFFNYSNPMTANCRAMTSRVGVNVVGLCHGVFHTQHELARLIERPYEETSTLFCGINHLTFIYDFRWKGESAWPFVEEKLGGAAGEVVAGSTWNDGSRVEFNPFSWEVYRRLGAYAAPGDRHTTEFFPERFASGSYYGKTLGVDAFSLKEVLAYGDERYETMKREADGSAPLDEAMFHRSSGEQEQLLGILRSVLTDGRMTVSANVPNRGLVPNLPADAVVELPAVVTAEGVVPTAVRDFAPALAGIIQRRLAPVDTTVEAALTGSRELFAEAILLDGAISDPSEAVAIVDDFISEQRDHLPRFM